MRSGEACEALFRTWDSRLVAAIAALGRGLTGISKGGGSVPPAGTKSDPAQPPKEQDWVLVRVDDLGVHLFASDRSGARGPVLGEASPGTFRASLYRYIGEIQLILFFPDQDSVTLKGRWTPLQRKPIQVARAVLGLAART